MPVVGGYLAKYVKDPLVELLAIALFNEDKSDAEAAHWRVTPPKNWLTTTEYVREMYRKKAMGEEPIAYEKENKDEGSKREVPGGARGSGS